MNIDDFIQKYIMKAFSEQILKFLTKIYPHGPVWKYSDPPLGVQDSPSDPYSSRFEI